MLERIHIQVQPFHVVTFVHDLQDDLSPPSVKQRRAAIRMLFGCLVTGHVIETNPAHSVRGPVYSVKKGKTAILMVEEAHAHVAGRSYVPDPTWLGVLLMVFW